MKFYIHSEDPVLTVVVQWEDHKIGKVKDILDVFCNSLYQKYPSLNKDMLFSISNTKGKVLDQEKEVTQLIKNKEDLFVKIEPKSHDISNVSRKLEAASISAVDAKDDKKKTDDKDIVESKDLNGKKNAALVQISNERYRRAINIYKEMLAMDKDNLPAIKGLITCYLRADRYREAIFYSKQALAMSKEETEILSLAGESFLKAGDGDKAIELLMKLCKLMRQKGVATASEKQDIQVLLAKAYLVKGQKDMAITILQGLLRENVEHTDALAEYASLLYSIGTSEHKEEAISAILTALVNRRTDKSVKQKFAEMMMTQDGMVLLKKVAANVLIDASALMFLAITVREFGAIEQTLQFLEMAIKAEPLTVCVLTYIHTLELVERHGEAMKYLLQYCQTFPGKGIGNLTYSDLIPFLESINPDLSGVKVPCDQFDSKIGVAPEVDYCDEDLYVLGLFFTFVKILYVKGLLILIPPLLKLIEPFCIGRDLHLTLVRNEVAYFKCISEVFKDKTEIPDTSDTKDKSYMFFVGDSHCIPVAWRQTTYKGAELTLYPILSTGTKIWHLRPESVFYPKTNFMSVIKNIPDGAIVTSCLGEIDCREAFLQCWEKARYDTIEEAMEVVVSIYIQLLKNLQTKNRWTIFIHPVLPVLDLTRPIVMQFNRILATRLLREPGLKWLNFVDDLFTEDGASLKEEYKLDGTHMHPRYLKVFTAALNQHN